VVTAFCDVMPCSIGDIYRRFGGTWCLPSLETSYKTFRSIKRVSLKIRTEKRVGRHVFVRPKWKSVRLVKFLVELFVVRFYGRVMLWLCACFVCAGSQTDTETDWPVLIGAAQTYPGILEVKSRRILAFWR